ncbi:hypothetical protein [Bacillus luti]|nr:hypothetical protein [Bacillus cereus]HDR8328882.1 hypothetical protein [Bacillus cereus]HDR8334316.1 hypothetical protein [Bacillus cereus]
MGFIGIFFSLVLFALTIGIQYAVYKKAGIEYAWFAFTVVLGFIPFFHLINRSAWNILWYFLPFFTMIFCLPFLVIGSWALTTVLVFVASLAIVCVTGIIFNIKFLKAFGLSPWLILLYFIPYLNVIMNLVLMGYIAFSKNVKYEGTLYSARWKRASLTK